VFRFDNQVLLERRPSSGIWGGLWCFPEKNGKGRKLAVIEHGFTHYRLEIQPLLRELAKKIPAGPSQRWMRLAEVAAAAVPTPVRRLIPLLG